MSCKCTRSVLKKIHMSCKCTRSDLKKMFMSWKCTRSVLKKQYVYVINDVDNLTIKEVSEIRFEPAVNIGNTFMLLVGN